MPPLCFVLMPFGRKPSPGGGEIDFDAVYETLFRPAIENAGLTPLRADEEQGGGIIHKPMFERLLLCDYALADLTTANANVFYELGVRHAAKRRTTALAFAQGLGQLPFDVRMLRATPYALGPDGRPVDAATFVRAMTGDLAARRKNATDDSPLWELVDDYPAVKHEKTDVFRDRVVYLKSVKDRLAVARSQGAHALREVELSLGDFDSWEGGALVDLMLSYRAVKAFDDMVRIGETMPDPLGRSVLVREQLAFGLNRARRHAEAERVLSELIAEAGASSETYGLLGRVYKDLWDKAKAAGDPAADGWLEQAIDAYRRGFEADWRDAYPGVNLVTLLTLRDSDDPELPRVLPVVRYAVERRIDRGAPDYWDFATLLELAVLAEDWKAASKELSRSLTRADEAFKPETTARNLGLIAEARRARGGDAARIDPMVAALMAKHATLTPPASDG